MRLDHLLSKEFLLSAPGHIGRTSGGELIPVEALASVLGPSGSRRASVHGAPVPPGTILSSALRERLTDPDPSGSVSRSRRCGRLERIRGTGPSGVRTQGPVRPLRTA